MLQTHKVKLHAIENKQNQTAKEKSAEISLIKSMDLNCLLTGVESRIGRILRTSNSNDIISAISGIKQRLSKPFGTNP